MMKTWNTAQIFTVMEIIGFQKHLAKIIFYIFDYFKFIHMQHVTIV